MMSATLSQALLSSISPPSTDCSLSMECGGVFEHDEVRVHAATRLGEETGAIDADIDAAGLLAAAKGSGARIGRREAHRAVGEIVGRRFGRVVADPQAAENGGGGRDAGL